MIAGCNLFADALGMAISDYFSSKAEAGAQESSKKKEKERFSLKKEEMDELLMESFFKRGYDPQVAENLVKYLSKCEEIYLDFYGTEISGYMPDDQESASPIKEGIFTFFSFIIIGIKNIFFFFFF